MRIKDVARVELGSENYKALGRLDGKPAAVMTVFLLPGANQIKAAEGLYETLAELKHIFPPDVDYKIAYDTTPAVEESIHEIIKTLDEAIILVLLVVFIFLQNWRATLIPLMTVPVSLVGTFIFYPMLGFSVNVLSMFGLVLAIGIVVDDAIVVVEAVMHHIEHGMKPKEATQKAMEEVSSAVIGVALVLSAVFIPVAFMGGLVGSMYKQFALTIAIAVLISAFNALTLSPALAALLLKPAKEGGKKNLLDKGFGYFNRGFDRVTSGYVRGAGMLVRKAVLSLVIIAVVAAGSGGIGSILRKGFVPDEDQGIFMINVQLPNAASLERTDAVMRQIEGILDQTRGDRGVQHDRRPRHADELLQRQLRLVLRAPQAVGGARIEGPARQRDHGQGRRSAAADPRSDRLPLRPAHHRGLRRRRRLQLPAAGPQRHADHGRPRRADPQFPDRRAPAPGTGQPVHLVRPRRAADRSGAGPREGAQAGRADQRRLRRAAGHPRRHLRERLQPLRPPLPRLRHGRTGVPAEARGHRQLLRPQPHHRRHGPAVDPGHRGADLRHRDHHALQPAARRSRSPASRRPASPRARP